MRRICVLLYHRVGGLGRGLNVRVSDFERQVGWFSRLGYRSLTVAELAERLRQGAPLPRRTVVWTFDDGCANAVENAAPILLKAGFVGTFYVVPRYVGGASGWDGFVGEPLADWQALRRLQEAGFEIGNHTMSHPFLTRLSPDEICLEIQQASEAIREQVGVAPQTFCYPYGEWDGTVRGLLIRAGFLGACTTRPGWVGADADPFTIPRLTLAYSSRSIGLLYKIYLRPIFR